MPKCVIICGPPASGKSTLAVEFWNDGYFELNRDWFRFNQVQPGGDWTTWDFSKENEVQKLWKYWFNHYVNTGSDFVISDTLCKPKDRNKIIRNLQEHSYEVILIILNPDLEVLIERDRDRGKMSVGADVITGMWRTLNASF